MINLLNLYRLSPSPRMVRTQDQEINWLSASPLIPARQGFLTWIFHTPERRVRARGLQQGCALVGRVPSRGAVLAFPSECELSGLRVSS